MFGIFRSLRRRRLRERPFPEPWLEILERRVPFFAMLQDPLRASFLEKLKIFVWEKHFFGAGGLEVTDEHRVTIAAAAVRLIAYLDLRYYDRLTEIIVYPDAYEHPDDHRGSLAGVVLGEAHDWGTVVLSWAAVTAGLANPSDGRETAAHEFAHVLDRGGGAFDGTPELRSRGDYGRWAEVMSEHFLNLRDAEPTERKVLDMYGATNEAEFFAVATESFFEKGRQMKEDIPALYEELSRFYGADPASDPLPDSSPPHVPPARQGKNERCACGSGRRYRRCCGRCGKPGRGRRRRRRKRSASA